MFLSIFCALRDAGSAKVMKEKMKDYERPVIKCYILHPLHSSIFYKPVCAFCGLTVSHLLTTHEVFLFLTSVYTFKN